MTITTKFNVGDKVWLIENNSAIQKTINKVFTESGLKYTSKGYKLNFTLKEQGENVYPEEELFSTKEELLASL